MTAPTDLEQLESARRHRRQARRMIVAPVVGAGLLLIVIVLLLVVSVSPVSFTQPAEQTAIVSTIMLICVALFPVFLCLLLFYAGLLVALYYTGRANRQAAILLRKTQVVSREVTDRTNAAADQASQWSIRTNAKLARLDPLLKWFERRGEHSDVQKGDANDE